MSQIAFVSIVGAAGPFPGNYQGAPKPGLIPCHQFSYRTTTAVQNKGSGQSSPSVAFVIALDAIGSKLFHAQRTKERLKSVTFSFYHEVSGPALYELQCKNAAIKQMAIDNVSDVARTGHLGPNERSNDLIRVTLVSETVTLKQLSSNKPDSASWKT